MPASAMASSTPVGSGQAEQTDMLAARAADADSEPEDGELGDELPPGLLPGVPLAVSPADTHLLPVPPPHHQQQHPHDQHQQYQHQPLGVAIQQALAGQERGPKPFREKRKKHKGGRGRGRGRGGMHPMGPGAPTFFDQVLFMN